jgi:anti-sigma B factor antagonist
MGRRQLPSEPAIFESIIVVPAFAGTGRSPKRVVPKEAHMETAIGVFSSRDHAEQAAGELLRRGVPEQSLVFLTRSENEAKVIAKQLGAFVGGFAGGAVGMSAGVVAATLLVPGVGAVFALGFGAAALLGLTGAGAGAAIGTHALPHGSEVPQPTPSDQCSDDAAFFREVLKEGRSLIVVRTESQELAKSACEVLDGLGICMQERTPAKMQATTRHIGDVVVLDISGRIALGEGNVMLREMLRGLLENGSRKIVLNLGGVDYVDSSGIGELVKTHTTVRNQGGKLTLVNLTERVNNLLEMTRLVTVFDIEPDEVSVVKSLGDQSATQAVA